MHKIIQADIYSALNSFEDNSIDVVVTSPPYWSQRNYGFDEQIGNEETYIEFISKLVFIFDILKKKLSEKGVFFLNIGDKYLNKYGKTPLGLIPYKLAFFMQQNGWVLNDTIIWHKPNHMPSSVKNRFVNSYEPVFVFSKNIENYFTDYVANNSDYENIIDINLQPTPYKHVAAYPEKLVTKLLDFTKINKEYTVLDPFAGSGTTLKVILDRNNNLYQKYKAKGILIEYNPEYIEIIKKRTQLQNVKIEKIKFCEYDFPLVTEKIDYNFIHESSSINDVNICQNSDEFYSILSAIQKAEFIQKFPQSDILFIGLNQFDIKEIYNISLIKNWIVRNMLVIRGKKWYPIFMLVHDNKMQKYNFNYKSLFLNHKIETKTTYFDHDFIGYKVVNSILKKKFYGKIVEILNKHENGLPKYVKVLWENDIVSKEFIIHDEDYINDNLNFYRQNGYVSVKEKNGIIKLNNIIGNKLDLNITGVQVNSTSKKYNGKFNGIERKNWGASPGARSSVEEEYFSVQRLYDVDQNLIADYLNYLRLKKGLTKIDFTNLFPTSYKHTVGHWLRKDFGGSIPVKEDWEKIELHFNIDPEIKNYACKTALKLQTVSKTKYKIPDDVVDIDFVNKLQKLNTTVMYSKSKI